MADTNATLDCLFKHPATAPFVPVRLIRALVKRNPTPAYVARAILTDAEARDDTAGASWAPGQMGGRRRSRP